jgi:lysophospholipase L1-like esterase
MTDIRVCFLGDSFTLGTGDGQALGWPGRVAAAERARGVDLTLYNLGVRGQTGAEIAARAPREVEERIRDRGDRRGFVVSFGANDIYQDRPVAESVRALRDLLAWSSSCGYAAFAVGAPPAATPELDVLRDHLNLELEAAARRLGAPFLDIRRALGDWSAWHREAAEGDGVHPNAEGYARVAAVFGAWAPWREWIDG